MKDNHVFPKEGFYLPASSQFWEMREMQTNYISEKQLCTEKTNHSIWEYINLLDMIAKLLSCIPIIGMGKSMHI